MAYWWTRLGTRSCWSSTWRPCVGASPKRRDLRPVVRPAVYDPPVAIELTDDLIQLQRAAAAAYEEAMREGYSFDAWAPWLAAAEAVQAAVTAHAAATRQNRYEVEMAVKAAVRDVPADS